MVLPIIFGVAALSAGAFGLSKGAEGAGSMLEAEEKRKKLVKLYETYQNRLKAKADEVNIEASIYGLRQKHIKHDVFIRVAAFIEKIGKRSNVDVYNILSGTQIPIPEVPSGGGRHKIKAESVFQGLLSSAGAASFFSTATTGAVTALGTASTGAAISGLSGAAANSAMLAALGGGSLAAGGGGMALGSIVLGGITVGPAIAFGGIAIAAEGEKALTKIIELKGQVKQAIAEIFLREAVLDGISKRLLELSDILERLKNEALKSLSELEALAESNLFDTTSDAQMEQFRALLLNVRSLAEIMRIPILDENGSINPNIDVVISMEAH
jgi:hypothetical protein